MRGRKTPDSWQKTEIMIILKQQTEPENLNSNRPITLANQDYKFFVKLLANRLEFSG